MLPRLPLPTHLAPAHTCAITTHPGLAPTSLLAAGVRKVVVISSMGGTQKDNFLNTIGDGNILVRLPAPGMQGDGRGL